MYRLLYEDFFCIYFLYEQKNITFVLILSKQAPYTEGGYQTFRFRRNITKIMVATDKSTLLEQVNLALDDIRPFLAVDGGNVEVVDITPELIVQVKWLGNCQNCSMSAMTMKAGIEQAVKSKLPNIVAVVAVN